MNIVIGLIGLGKMGLLYAEIFRKRGLKVNVCDLPNRINDLKKIIEDFGLNVCDGREVSSKSDFIIYSVEAINIDNVVCEFGPYTKSDAIVAGQQTSVKEPEILAFEKYLPNNVHIVTCHSLHGPTTDTRNQSLVLIKYRATNEKYMIVRDVLSCFKSKIVELSYEEHDLITANTQALTHIAFLSTGTAWKMLKLFPKTDRNVGGIENIKVIMSLRLYSHQFHVYASIAILNPNAKTFVNQYLKSISELFELIKLKDKQEFITRIYTAKEVIFNKNDLNQHKLLSDSVIDKYSLSTASKGKKKPNLLSLMAMVDCWYFLRINPYNHLSCKTPLYMLWIFVRGIIEYLFNDELMLNEAIQTALYDEEIQREEREFYNALIEWAKIVEKGDMKLYQKCFVNTAKFFGSRRLFECNKIGDEIIKDIAN